MDKRLTDVDQSLEHPQSHPIGAGIGATTGGVAGAVIGGLAGGPAGIVAGAAIGGSVGGAIGRDIAQDTQMPDLESSREHYSRIQPLLREQFAERPYAGGQRFEDFERAYLHGVSCHDRYGYQVWNPQIEQEMRQGWENDPGNGKVAWKDARIVIRDGWHAAERVGEQNRA